jgi:type I restriction enzyme M protein
VLSTPPPVVNWSGPTLTGEIRSQINTIWNAFWTGGISNPLEVIEQITWLLFLRRLDDHRHPRPFEDFRWSRFKNDEARAMFHLVAEHVFPFLRTLGADGSTYAHQMKDARFTIPTPALLAKVVDLLDHVPMDDRDTKGDIYEYMLGKIATAGQNGQFRTPRHIIRLMVELTAPRPDDVICDPASGTCGFLVAAGEYIRERHPQALRNAALAKHFHAGLFHGFDFDNTMLRIGSMNMMLHGVENPDIRYKDSLSQEHKGDEDAYTLVLANPPFAGSLDYENCAKDLLAIVKTKKTELLFLALMLRLLKPGGRAAVVVPDVSTAILIFTKTNSGGTDFVWFYDMNADGWSLDDKRQPLLSEDKLGVAPATPLTDEEHRKNNLPDIAARWLNRDTDERARPRTAQSFCVPKAEIAATGYDLSLNRYQEVVHEVVDHIPPGQILAELNALEAEIQDGLRQLQAMLQ